MNAVVLWYKGRKLRWEYRVEYAEQDRILPSAYSYYKTRREMRRGVRSLQHYGYIIVEKSRRLASGWEHYKDSFTWNNGNGKR
ncbi:MAG TPA: hypothetical protein VHA52_10525 [Candidatus Babeliaceae bacterium]|nr:hypothetical protein [Candidatus Babeliaceae bacterium]